MLINSVNPFLWCRDTVKTTTQLSRISVFVQVYMISSKLKMLHYYKHHLKSIYFQVVTSSFVFNSRVFQVSKFIFYSSGYTIHYNNMNSNIRSNYKTITERKRAREKCGGGGGKERERERGQLNQSTLSILSLSMVHFMC